MKIIGSLPIDQRPAPIGRNRSRPSRYYDFTTALIEAFRKGDGLKVALDGSSTSKGILAGGSLRHHVIHRLKESGDTKEYRLRYQVNADKTEAFVWIERIG